MMRPIVCLLATAGCLLGVTPDERAWQTLQRGLEDGNPAKRITAVFALSVVKPQPRPVKMVESMLQDKDFGVRQAACATLGEIRARTSIPLLRAALEDRAPEVVFAAAKALYSMGDATGRDVLTEILLGDQKGASGFVSSSLRDAKLKLHDPKALLLVGVNQAAALLGPFGAGVPIAEQLLKDGQASGKTIAALLLVTDSSVESRDAFRLALNDRNWTVRVAATRAIALRGIREFYADMASLLDDKREEVTYAAAAAMIRLKQPAPARPAATRPVVKTALQ
jgi:HEAT repeat protein